MTDLNALKTANALRWRNVKLTRNFTNVARALVAPAAKARYQAVEKRTGVPWWFIAVAHERESSQNWNGQLGQGDPLDAPSIHKPAGRGPFRTWEDSAYDALVNCAPWAARNKDWSIGGTLTKLEEYNGLGYASMGRPSPYIWAGTDQYVSGKYTSDGRYNPSVVDIQPGCAGLLIAMMALDRTISFDGKMPPIVILPNPTPIDVPPINGKPKTAIPKKTAGGAIVVGGAAAAFHYMEVDMIIALISFAAGFAACWFGRDKVTAWIASIKAKI